MRAREWMVGRPTAFWVGLVVIALIVFFQAYSGGVFLSSESIKGLALDAAVGILLAVGVTFLLASAQLDLSLGANLVLSSVVGAHVLTALVGGTEALTASGGAIALAALLAALASVATGLVFGLVNGLLVTRLRVNSFIATLGTGGAATGFVLVLTNGVNVTGFPSAIQTSFGTASIGDVLPYPSLLVLAICAVLWVVMHKTRSGMRAIALGSSRDAAVRSGIDANRSILSLFMLVGALAGLAGFLVITRFSTTNVGGSQDVALAAIAAAVIGGTSLFGGTASVGGSMVGALLPVILASGLIILGVSSFYQQIVVGVILIVAVYIDQQRRARRST